MATHNIDLFTETTCKQIATACAQIAVNTGGYKLTNYADAQAIVRMGYAPRYFHIGDQIVVEKETSMNATVGNSEGETSGITAASVDPDAFIAAVHTVHSGDYEFTFNGAEWHYNGAPVNLADYGISVTGTAVHGDEVIVHETAAKLYFDVIDIDKDTPSDPQFTHSLTLQLHDVYIDLQYCARQAAFAFAEGLAAGTYKFTVGAHPWVAGDVNKVLTFTLVNAIPAGGQLVFNGAYDKTLVGTTISVFASPTSTTAAETVTMTEGDTGTDLGTILRSKTDAINSIDRALLGSNNWLESAMRQYLNSDKAAGSVWTPQSVFDRPPTWAATTAGFLHGIDPDFVAVLGNVKKTTGLNNISDGGGTAVHDEKFFLLSRSEVYMGDEYTGGEDTPYAYYKNYSDNQSASTGADKNRIKYRAGAAKYWWLRSTDAGDARSVRLVTPSGVWSYNGATNAYGVAPACCIV
jgi:hypothetical protein